MSGYYPPGVVGNEPEIAGPAHEDDEQRQCPDGCPDLVMVPVTTFVDGSTEWTCPSCLTTFSDDPDEDDDQ